MLFPVWFSEIGLFLEVVFIRRIGVYANVQKVKLDVSMCKMRCYNSGPLSVCHVLDYPPKSYAQLLAVNREYFILLWYFEFSWRKLCLHCFLNVKTVGTTLTFFQTSNTLNFFLHLMFIPGTSASCLPNRLYHHDVTVN